MEYNYREISAQKSVSGVDFTRGLIDFNFSIGAPSVFVPRKSYFKITLQVNGTNVNVPLKASDCIALSDDCCGSLFNNAYFRIGGSDVSVVNNYVAQSSILKQRLGRANGWAKTLGLSTQMLESDFAKRLSKTAFAPSLENNKKLILPLADDKKASDDVKVAYENGVVTSVGGSDTTFADILVRQGNIMANNYVKNTRIVINGKEFVVNTCADNTHLTVDSAGEQKINDTADAYFICESPMDGDAKSQLDLIYQPPLGIFDLASGNLADEVLVGDFRISLNPNTNYESSVIESLRLGTPSTSPNTNPAYPIDPSFYNVSVQDIKFYACYCKMPIEPSFTKQISLSELLVMSKPLSGNSNTYEFSVPSSTTALAVWFQSSAMGSNPMYPPSHFKMLKDYQNNLNGIQITYANQSKPSTKWTSAYGNDLNKLVQRYRDNMDQNALLYNPAGAESLQDFLNRGLYILYSFEKDANDRSTQVQVSVDFTGIMETNASVYLCAIYDRQTEYTIANGAVASIRQSN